MLKITIKKKDAEHASKTGFDPVEVAISRRINCHPENIEFKHNRIECYEDDSMTMLYTVSEEDKLLIDETRKAWNYHEIEIDDVEDLNINIRLKRGTVEGYYA